MNTELVTRSADRPATGGPDHLGKDMDRRGWQVLASLSRGPTRHAELVTALASFDSPAVVEEVIDQLMSHGWVEESADAVMLTQAGAVSRKPWPPWSTGCGSR